MPFEIIRNDISKMSVDAIVNTANPNPVIGIGVDSMVHKAAGPELLLARQEIGAIARGDAAITPGFRLDAKYVIHTVGPVWEDGTQDEEKLLRSCYDRSLQLALEHDCESVAFPLISTGNYGFPKDLALQTAVAAFSSFLMQHEMMIYLVVFDRKSFSLSEKLQNSVASYIDEHYVELHKPRSHRRERPFREEVLENCMAMPSCAECVPMAPLSLEDMLKQEDCGFTDRLIQLLNQSGKKNSEVYKRAGISKQLFSKIISNPHYQPTKPTAIALAIGLELDYEGTQDLIGHAGFTLTNSSKFDLIIRYAIEHKIYNVVEIDLILFKYDQLLLGQ